MKPLVSVCIPTFNRRDRLQHAVESVLAQEEGRFELLILDNASTDGTDELGRDFLKRDSRVRYIRQHKNIGMVPNFLDARRRASGHYFMWLSDDDRIGPDYLRRCVGWLKSHPDYSLACGLARYHRDGTAEFDDIILNLPWRSPVRRILHWYYHMDWCGAFFGVMPRKLALRAPFRNTLGCDKLFVGAMAWMGKIITIPDVSLHRRLGGMSRTGPEQAAAQGLPRFYGRDRNLAMAIEAARDAIERFPYTQRTMAARAAFAAMAFGVIYLTRSELASCVYKVADTLRHHRRTDLKAVPV
jgi:glycosyltransferase involved in cell wall biosynthesis